MKIQYDNLMIEVTRRCNMSCAHCLRGDAQNRDISREVIEKIFENTESINCLTFGGGEISLNVEGLNMILEVAKEKDVDIYNFYAVTNGKEISEDFLITIMKWYAYTQSCNNGYQDEITGLSLSKDDFHECIPEYNEYLLKSFSFFRADKETDWNNIPLLNLGRAKTLSQGYQKREMRYYAPEPEFYNDTLSFSEMVSVTVNGDILSDCDYEYENTDEIKIGNVFDSNWYEKYTKAQAA